MSQIKTHETFIKELLCKNKQYINGSIKLISKYNGVNRSIILEDKYGKLKSLPTNLLKNKKVTIASALDKTKYWINMAKEVHGDTYDYSLVEYKNSRTKVKIICPEHGIFEQVPNNHLHSKSGCSKCGDILTANHNSKWTTENIRQVLKSIHPGLNFENSKYFGKNKKMSYFCKYHGERKSLPFNLLRGHGCKKCGEKICNGWTTTEWKQAAKKSKNFDSFKVYIIKCWNKEEKFYKIGKTYKTVENRFKYDNLMPYNYEIVKEIEGTAEEMSKLEKELQKNNKEQSYMPKLLFGGMHECFKNIKLTD